MLSNEEKPDYDIRKIKTIERELVKSINIEKLIGYPVKKLNRYLEACISKQGKNKVKTSLTTDSIDNEMRDDSFDV